VRVRLVEEILASLDAQAVAVPGSNAAEIALPKLADSLKEVLQQRKCIADDVERMLEVGGGSAFASAAHLAAYAGIAPVTHSSGSSIRAFG
jgi:transposase